jgi:hypothetical protein
MSNTQSEHDKEPVLMVVTPDNYIVHVGDPTYFKGSEITKYLKRGYKVNTVTLKEYKECGLKWIFDKPKTTKTNE